jgi:ABC-type transport system involved in Fe-S cluster assembly fused permease/ATPase subunit
VITVIVITVGLFIVIILIIIILFPFFKIRKRNKDLANIREKKDIKRVLENRYDSLNYDQLKLYENEQVSYETVDNYEVIDNYEMVDNYDDNIVPNNYTKIL